MRAFIENQLLGLLQGRMRRNARRVELLPKYAVSTPAPLTQNEKRQIRELWGSLGTVKDFRTWELFKAQAHFDPAFVPDDIFVSSIIRVLNPIEKVYCLQNKNMYPLIYHDLPMPRVYISCIDSLIYTPDGDVVAPADIERYVPLAEGPIVKPSSDSCSGQGVARVHNATELRKTISALGSNYVVQQYIEQSALTARFNPGSLNTFRINTLYINGKVSTINIMFRHGQGSSIVDNAGAGGVFCGVDTAGRFIGRRLDSTLADHELTAFSVPYSSLVMPEVRSLCALAEASHKKHLPMMGHVAWDWALSADNSPILVEVNLGWPGIITEQLSSCRPIYGSRTREVINYVAARKNTLSFTDFIGHWT